MTPGCNVFWGSHGCSLDEGHELPHQCGSDEDPCCQHDGGTQVRFHYGTPGTIAEGARVDAKGYGPWAGYGGTFT
jgi:hypothetical protein